MYCNGNVFHRPSIGGSDVNSSWRAYRDVFSRADIYDRYHLEKGIWRSILLTAVSLWYADSLDRHLHHHLPLNTIAPCVIPGYLTSPRPHHTRDVLLSLSVDVYAIS